MPPVRRPRKKAKSASSPTLLVRSSPPSTDGVRRPRKKAKSASSPTLLVQSLPPSTDGVAQPVQPPSSTDVVSTTQPVQPLISPEQLQVLKQTLNDTIVQTVKSEVKAAMTQIQGSQTIPECDLTMTNAVQSTVQEVPVPTERMTLQDAVGTILQANSHLGESNSLVRQAVTFDLPLGATLSDKVRSKIRQGEYVELEALLHPTSEDLTIQVQPDKSATISLAPNKKRDVTSIEQWTAAMHIYGSIYLPAHQEEIAQYFKYLDFVTNMAKRSTGYAWRVYDETFRRARQFTDLPWDRPLINQYIGAISATTANSNTNTSGQRQNQTIKNQPFRTSSGSIIPRGFCYGFNNQKGCSNNSCIYKHQCAVCSAQHSATKCNKQSAQSKQKSHSSKGSQ